MIFLRFAVIVFFFSLSFLSLFLDGLPKVFFTGVLLYPGRLDLFHCTPKKILRKNCSLTLSWRGLLSYRNQSIDLQSKSMDWFLYDNGPRRARVKDIEMFLKISNAWYPQNRYERSLLPNCPVLITYLI